MRDDAHDVTVSQLDYEMDLSEKQIANSEQNMSNWMPRRCVECNSLIPTDEYECLECGHVSLSGREVAEAILENQMGLADLRHEAAILSGAGLENIPAEPTS